MTHPKQIGEESGVASAGPAPRGIGMPAGLAYLAALAMTGLAVIIASALDLVASVPNLSLIFVLPVLVAAVLSGIGPSMLAAVAGALAYNYFFTAPRFSLHVEDPANIWAIGLLFVVGAVASGVASTAARRKSELGDKTRQLRAVRAYANALGGVSQPDAIARLTADTLHDIFHVPVCVLQSAEDGLKTIAGRGDFEPQAQDLQAAGAALEGARFTRAGIYPFDSARFFCWPVVDGGQGASFVFGLAFDPDDYPDEPENFVDAVATLFLLKWNSGT